MAGLPPTDDSPLKVYMKRTKRSSKQPPKIVEMPERLINFLVIICLFVFYENNCQ